MKNYMLIANVTGANVRVVAVKSGRVGMALQSILKSLPISVWKSDIGTTIFQFSSYKTAAELISNIQISIKSAPNNYGEATEFAFSGFSPVGLDNLILVEMGSEYASTDKTVDSALRAFAMKRGD